MIVIAFASLSLLSQLSLFLDNEGDLFAGIDLDGDRSPTIVQAMMPQIPPFSYVTEDALRWVTMYFIPFAGMTEDMVDLSLLHNGTTARIVYTWCPFVLDENLVNIELGYSHPTATAAHRKGLRLLESIAGVTRLFPLWNTLFLSHARANSYTTHTRLLISGAARVRCSRSSSRPFVSHKQPSTRLLTENFRCRTRCPPVPMPWRDFRRMPWLGTSTCIQPRTATVLSIFPTHTAIRVTSTTHTA